MSRLGDAFRFLMGRTTQMRASGPIMFAPEVFSGIGTANGAQPDSSVLLRESLGWAAIATRAIADRVSSLEFEVVAKRSRNGTTDEEVIDDHPLKMLLDKPSPLHSRRATLRLTAQYLVTVGEAYWLKVSGQRTGLPRELYVMQADRVKPIVSGGLIGEYEVMDGQGRLRKYSADEVIRFWMPDPETIYGAEGYLGPQGIDVDGMKFASQHLRSRFQNDATPPTVITGTPDAVSPINQTGDMERFEEGWRTRFHGVMGSKRGLPAWLPSGWDVKQLQMMGGQELVPLLEYWRDMALMAYGTPRSVLGQVVSGDRSSAETNQFVFDQHTILPLTLLIADAITDQLAQRNFDRHISVRFAKFVADDKDHELKKESQDLTLKVRSINKLLEDRGDDPVSWGELPVGSFADIPYTGEMPAPNESDDPTAFDDGPPPEEEEPEDDEPRTRSLAPDAEWQRVLQREHRFTSPFERGMLRIFAAQRRAVLEELGKLPTPREAPARIDPTELDRLLARLFDGSWGDLFRAVIEPVRRRLYSETYEQTVTQLGLGVGHFVFQEKQVAIVNRIGASLVVRVNETTRRRLRAELTQGIAEGESVDGIKKRINGVFQGRRSNARTIARTEVLRTSQRAQIEGFGASGVVAMKRWNTSRDNRVRDSHEIDGQEVPLNDQFVLTDGEYADAPGVGSGGGDLSAANTINCRCFVTPVVEA